MRVTDGEPSAALGAANTTESKSIIDGKSSQAPTATQKQEGSAWNGEASAKLQSEPSKKSLTIGVMLLMALGESVQGIYATIAGFHLNAYFLEVCCLDPAEVGMIQLIQGFFDAFNDPLIGYLSDHTRTRWGRRRPWLLFGGPFLAAAYFAMWNKLPNDISPVVRFLYYLVTYMSVSVGITCIQVQIASLAPELTDDYDERTALSAFRLLAVLVAGLICAVTHSILISSFPDEVDGYRASGGSFAFIMLCCTWCVFCGIKEKFKADEQSAEKLSVIKELRTIFNNRPFWCVVGMYLCGPTGVVLVQTNIFMFCKYILHNGDLIVFIILAVQGLAILTAPFWVFVGKTFGKKQITYFGGTVLCTAMLCVTWLDNQVLAVVLSSFIGMSIAAAYLAPYSMLPDVIEEDELTTGKRREGLFSGFFTISLKLTVTLSLTITNFLLKMAGYSAPIGTCGTEEEIANDKGESDTQPDAVLLCLRLLCGPIPAFMVLMAMLCAWAYPITRDSHEKTLEAIAAVKATRSMTTDGESSVTARKVNSVEPPPNVTAPPPPPQSLEELKLPGNLLD